jgi:hypothetical protein
LILTRLTGRSIQAGVKSVNGMKLGVDNTIRPAVVLSAPHALDNYSISETLQTFHNTDDVFSADFQDVLVLQVPPGFDRKLIPQSALGFNSIFTLTLEDEATGVPPGPYFLQNRTLHQAWRLYTDDLDAFITTVIPDDVHQPKRSVLSPVVARTIETGCCVVLVMMDLRMRNRSPYTSLLNRN